MTLVLQWRQPAPRFALRWHGREGGTGFARATLPPATIATIVGPPGPAGRASFSCTASIALSGHRFVAAAPDGHVRYPDIDDPEDAFLLVGLTLGAALAGAPIEVQAAGPVEEPSWTWSPGPIFVGPAGVLTQSRPGGAWLRQIATAIAPTRILLADYPSVLTQ